mmetsp:Transcript_121453/g.288605  ORF Transcript_121453/g.288605 Transcript_121453/m.288605 type:complete len:299 (-) Transcript_121453:2282-3178(-)
MECLHLLQDARLRRIPGLKRCFAKGALHLRLQHVEPPRVPHTPNGVQRHGIALLHSLDEEVPKLVLVHVHPGLVVKAFPDHQEVFVQFLGEVKVEALSSVAHRPRVLGGVHDALDEPIRRCIPEAILRHVGMKALFMGLLQHLQPSRGPRGRGRSLQEALSVVQSPECQLRLLRSQSAVPHVGTAHSEGIEVRDHWFHRGLRIGNQQAVGVHGIVLVVLVEHHIRLGATAQGLQIHVHKRRRRDPSSLPPHGRLDVRLLDKGIAKERLRQVEPRGGVRVQVDDAPVLDVKCFTLQKGL